jgi:hypothetical protein
VYEKEIRKGRKEAFKSGSSLVKLQEELKATRNSLRITQSGLESEKLKSARREQEAFTAQYQLISEQEELQKAQERIQVVEAERDALKTSLQEEEVARIAAEGRIALPTMEEDDEDLLMHSPRKSPRKPRLASEDTEGENKENRVPKKTFELQNLHEELTMERRLREKAQEQVEFMKMECQFQCCSCRIAEKDGHGYVHDMSFVSEMKEIRELVPLVHTPPASEPEDVEMTVEHEEHGFAYPEPEDVEETMEPIEKSFQTTLEPTEIFHSAAETEKEIVEVQVTEEFDVEITHEEEPAPAIPSEAPTSEDDPFTSEPQDPQTPHHEIRTVTTTTTIPMMFSPFPVRDVPTTPMTLPASRPAPLGGAEVPPSPFQAASAFKADGTLDREAALALIRERRGRARSVAMGMATPRKQMVEGVAGGRRDISAPNRL